MWITNRDLNHSVRKVLEVAEKLTLEGAAKEQAKGGTLNYMRVQLE